MEWARCAWGGDTCVGTAALGRPGAAFVGTAYVGNACVGTGARGPASPLLTPVFWVAQRFSAAPPPIFLDLAF